eukprot:m.108111 g.108111  ORF g.108111 m.108111 type:complete len:97 (+) comp9187_c0_seq1:5339-5629(+)
MDFQNTKQFSLHISVVELYLFVNGSNCLCNLTIICFSIINMELHLFFFVIAAERCLVDVAYVSFFFYIVFTTCTFEFDLMKVHMPRLIYIVLSYFL